MGAALAYYIALSLAPTVVILLAIISLAFGAQAAEGRLVAANSSSSWPLTVSVTDSLNRTQFANLVLQVQAPIVVTSTAPSNFQFIVGQNLTTVPGSSITFQPAGGSSPYTWSAANPPPGLHMDAPSGTLVGTPTQPEPSRQP